MAGRKRKKGPRTKSGQLSRKGVLPRIDRGTEITEAKIAMYGSNGSDAIGRAYMAGMLGEDAKPLLDTARKVSRIYWQSYEVGPIRCTTGGTSGGGNEPDHERIKRQEEWLNDKLGQISTRSIFDALVIDVNPDRGPAWLDRLLVAKRLAREPLKADMDNFCIAIDALERISE